MILYFCNGWKENIYFTISIIIIIILLGKGGSKIAEIRQMSGANIQISKSADKEPTAERQIQITGDLHAYLQPGLRIRIRIGSVDPDPGGQK
jgi:hypothetical protein